MTLNEFDIAIIGDGLAAAVLVMRISHRCLPVRVAIIGDRGAVGYGRAYSEPSNTALTNAPVSAMSIPDVPGFDQWLHSYCATINDPDYVPRKLFGDYVAEQFSAARCLIEDFGGTVNVFTDTANHLERITNDRWFTCGKNGTQIVSHRVALCVGTAEADVVGFEATSGYIANPYPLSELISRIPKGGSIATLGTGLSAVDIALTVRDRAPESSVVVASRSGLFPAIRGKPAVDIDFYCRTVLNTILSDKHTNFDLDWYAELIDQCVIDATCSTTKEWGGMASILDVSAKPIGTSAEILQGGTLSPTAPSMATAGALLRATGAAMWQRITPSEKVRFNAEWRPQYHRLCNPMPMRSAVALAQMVRDGVLTVVKNPKIHAQETGYEFRTASGCLYTDIFVNATGFSKTQIPINARDLVAGLASRGELERSVWGGIRVHEDTPCTVVDSTPSCSLFVIGQMSSGDRLLSNSIAAIAADCDFLVGILERS